MPPRGRKKVTEDATLIAPETASETAPDAGATTLVANAPISKKAERENAKRENAERENAERESASAPNQSAASHDSDAHDSVTRGGVSHVSARDDAPVLPKMNGLARGDERADDQNREESTSRVEAREEHSNESREDNRDESRGDESRASEVQASQGQSDEGQNQERVTVQPASEERQSEERQSENRVREDRPREERPREERPREERPFENRESRGLRFRGRDGRAEVRDNRNDAPRNDNRSDGRNDNRGETRGFRSGRENGNGSGRLAQPRDAMRSTPEYGRTFERGEARGDNRERIDSRHERDVVRGRNDLDLTALEEKNLTDLRDIATELGITETTAMQKSDLVYRILEAQAETSGNLFKHGILEILPDGKGFLRTEGYLAGNEDVYVSQSQIKRFNLRTGDMVSGQVRAPKEMERYYGLLRVEATNGEAPDITRTRKEFEKLTPIFPDEKFILETDQSNITARIIDLVSPIGKGQRGLIVAPPKAGKTTLIKSIANSIAANHPEVYLIVLLIDERPEEVTDISRSVKGEVVASTFDETPENHMRVADMVLEKAKRMVEQKKDVVILMDSLTRLSRASNLVVAPSGRTMSGGLDPAAMYKPKRMFGAARNIEEGGSLTILATALVDTGSRMDDYIFEEFKGTGNLDLVLDRSLFDQRIFPSIDINRSGTRRDDLLLSKDDLAAVFHLRRTLAALDNDKAITLLIDRLKNTKTNDDFMQVVQKSARQNSQ